MLCNFIRITLRHGCSAVNLLHIFRNIFIAALLEAASNNSSHDADSITEKHMVNEFLHMAYEEKKDFFVKVSK